MQYLGMVYSVSLTGEGQWLLEGGQSQGGLGRWSYAVCSVAQSCPTLCNPMDCSLPGSSVHVILRARILGCRALLQGMDLPSPGIEPASLMSPALAGGFFTTSATWEAQQGRDANSRPKTGLAGSALIFNYCAHTKWSSAALPPLRGVFDFTSHDFLNI